MATRAVRVLKSTNARLLATLVLGIAVGLLAPPSSLWWLPPLGHAFVELLKTIMLPIVVCMLVGAIGSMPLEGLGRAGRRTLGWCLGASLLASMAAVAIAAAIRPGAGLTLPSLAPPSSSERPGLLEMLVPGNVVAAAAQGNMLGVLCFTAVFALALKQLRRRGSAEIQRSVDGLVDLARTGSEALAIVLRWIMLYAPVGVFALTALTFSTIGLRALVPFVKVHVAIDLTLMVLCAAAALLLHRRGVGAVRFIRAAQAPLVTALSTQSSAATLPAELACVQRELGVPLSLAGLAIPMAVSLMKVGSAVFLGVMAVFAAEVGGLALTPRRLALIMLATWIGSIATAPVSGGAMVQLTLVFAEADLPTSVIPLVAGIPFAGKLNTVMNVAGHLAVTALVSQREKAEHVAGVPVAQPA